MADKPKPLTRKQRRFVEEYAASDGNATQAYFRAFGRTTKDGARRTYRGAQVESSKLLSNPIVKAEVELAEADYRKRLRVTKAKTLREVAALAFADHGDVMEEDPVTKMPTPIAWGSVAPAARRAIQSVKIKRRIIKRPKSDEDYQEEIEEVEYKFHAKGAELDKLCKKLGMYDEKDADGGPQTTAEADAMGRLAALVNARRPVPERTGRGGGGPGGPAAVDPAAGTAEPGVPQ